MKKLLPILLVTLLLSGCIQVTTTPTTPGELTAEQLQEKKDNCYVLIATMIKYETDLYPNENETSVIDEIFYHQPTDSCYYAGELLITNPDGETGHTLYIKSIDTLKPVYTSALGGEFGIDIRQYDTEYQKFIDKIAAMRAGEPL